MRSSARRTPRLASPEVDECDDMGERAKRKDGLTLELENQVLRQSSLISPGSVGGNAAALSTRSPSLSPSASPLKLYSHFHQAGNTQVPSCTCRKYTRNVLSGSRTFRDTQLLPRRAAMIPLSQSFSGRFESLSAYGNGESGGRVGEGSTRWSCGFSKSPWQRFPAMLHNSLGRYLSRNSINVEKNFLLSATDSVDEEYRENCAPTSDSASGGASVVRSVSCYASLSSGLAGFLLLKVILFPDIESVELVCFDFSLCVCKSYAVLQWDF